MKRSIDNSRGAPKLKVLFWNELYRPHVGGVERFSEELISALNQQGFEFRVVTSCLPGSPSEESFDGVRVHRLPLRSGLTGSKDDFKLALESVIALKREFQPHLTHLNTNGPSFVYHLLTRKINPHPTLFTLHFDVSKNNAVDSLARILNDSDRITAVSQDTLRKALDFFPGIASKSSVIYNGLAPPAEDFSSLAPEPAKFLCWGRLASNKGFDVALRAFARVVSEHPQARLTLAGEGPERPSLAALLAHLGIETKVAMPGFLDPSSLEAEIRSSTAVLMPSLEQECFGLVALEAMQRGRPVIASRYGGLAEVVSDGVTGQLFRPGDDSELASAMLRFAAQPELVSAMGLAGMRRAREKFSVQGMADRYERLYREMIV